MINPFFVFCFFLIFSLTCKAEIASFWKMKLDSSKGYCENPIKEKEMWIGINTFAKSIKDTLPGIPPTQTAYIERERNSKNPDRQINLLSYPFYIINQTLIMADNMDQLSSLYLANQNRLTFPKKVEITARVLLNVTSPSYEFSYANTLAKKLSENDYKIESLHLIDISLSLLSARSILLNNLICHGEK